MTKKPFKYLLLVSVFASMMAGSRVLADSALSYTSDAVDTIRGIDTFAKTLEKLSVPDDGNITMWPVIDITSVPAHAVVGVEQKLIRRRTKVEDELKDHIRRRLSQDRKKILTTEIKEKEGEGEEGSEKKAKKPERVDGKLSKIEIKTDEATGNVEGGLVGEGANGEVTDAGKSTTRELSDTQRKGYLSSAGSLSEREKYELQRQYQEQEEAIRMLALAAALRSSIDEKLMPMMEEAEGHYNRSFVKKDLDPKNREPNVRSKTYEAADQNLAWRDYTYFSVIYDQLLSLEQQVMGLRLQAKGGLAEQSTEPVVEIEYTDG